MRRAASYGRNRPLATSLVVVGTLAACSMSTTLPSDGSSMSDTGTTIDDTGATGDAAAPMDAATCVDPANVIAGAGRACGTPDDCAIAAHQTDCCGSLEVHGIRRDALAAFEATEDACRALFPACGCESGQVTADDGAAAPLGSGSTAIIVACETGACTTHVRPRVSCIGGVAICTPTQVCVDNCMGRDSGPDTDRHCVDVVPACVNATDCSCLGTNDPCTLGCGSIEQGIPHCNFC